MQVLNRLKNGCPQPAHPVSRLKKSFLLNSFKVPTLKALCLKEFLRVWNFKRECGSSSPKLTPHTHPVCMGSVSERNEVSKFSSSIVVSIRECGEEDDFWQAVKGAVVYCKFIYCL